MYTKKIKNLSTKHQTLNLFFTLHSSHPAYELKTLQHQLWSYSLEKKKNTSKDLTFNPTFNPIFQQHCFSKSPSNDSWLES